MKKYFYNRFWLIIFGGVVIISVIITSLLRLAPLSYAYIYQNNMLTETVNVVAVSEPFNIEVRNDDNGSVNVIAVEHKRIRMLAADCPDGICVRQGWINSGAIPIVCLPNRIVIKFKSGNEADVDAVVG
jgi:hypothetical protein